MFTGIRQRMGEKKSAGVALGVGLILVAAIALAVQHMPEKKADLNQAFFTTNDGATWFPDSAYRVAPFDHEGKEAVIAQVYSYDGGKKQFCAYVAKYTPEARQKLEPAIARARANNEPPNSVALFRDHNFMKSGMLVKARGAGQPWVPMSDPKANEVMAVRSPDGSEVDQVFIY